MTDYSVGCPGIYYISPAGPKLTVILLTPVTPGISLAQTTYKKRGDRREEEEGKEEEKEVEKEEEDDEEKETDM